MSAAGKPALTLEMIAEIEARAEHAPAVRLPVLAQCLVARGLLDQRGAREPEPVPSSTPHTWLSWDAESDFPGWEVRWPDGAPDPEEPRFVVIQPLCHDENKLFVWLDQAEVTREQAAELASVFDLFARTGKLR